MVDRAASASRPVLYFFTGRGLRMRNRMLTYDGVSMGAPPSHLWRLSSQASYDRVTERLNFGEIEGMVKDLAKRGAQLGVKLRPSLSGQPGKVGGEPGRTLE